MRLADHLTAVTALRAWCKQCLPGRSKPDVLRPGTIGMHASRVHGVGTYLQLERRDTLRDYYPSVYMYVCARRSPFRLAFYT